MNELSNLDEIMHYEWVKMAVPNKKPEFYNASPGYKLIGKNDVSNLYAFKRPVSDDEPLPYHLEKCTEFESNKLEKLTNIEH